MEGDGFPCDLYLFFRDLVRSKELTSRVCTIDFEALVGTREFLKQTEIVECG